MQLLKNLRLQCMTKRPPFERNPVLEESTNRYRLPGIAIPMCTVLRDLFSPPLTTTVGAGQRQHRFRYPNMLIIKSCRVEYGSDYSSERKQKEGLTTVTHWRRWSFQPKQTRSEQCTVRSGCNVGHLSELRRFPGRKSPELPKTYGNKFVAACFQN